MLELMSYINAYLLRMLPETSQTYPSDHLIPAITLYPGRIFPTVIHEDFFPGDEDYEVICRHDPSPVLIKRYLTGAYRAQFNFSYFAKAPNVIQARQTIEAIMDTLQLENFEGLFGITNGRLDCVARPTPVQELEGGATIYTSSFRLVYFQEV